MLVGISLGPSLLGIRCGLMEFVVSHVIYNYCRNSEIVFY